jgi:hypothetical protein
VTNALRLDNSAQARKRGKKMDARANAQRLSRSAAVACLRVLTRNGFRAVQPLLVSVACLFPFEPKKISFFRFGLILIN